MPPFRRIQSGSGGGGGQQSDQDQMDDSDSVPMDQLGGSAVDAGSDPGDRDTTDSTSVNGDGPVRVRPSETSTPQDQGPAETAPDTQGHIPGSPQDPSGTSRNAQQDLTQAEIEAARDRTPRASQSVSFGTTGTPTAAAGRRSADYQQAVRKAEGRAEGVAYSDRELFEAESKADAESFSEGVQASDRKLFEAAAEAERVGDINWTKVVRGTAGPGGSDPFEERLDSFLDKRATSIEDVGEAAGGFIRGNTERARPIGEGGIRDLADPTYQVRGFPADVVEGGFSLASDAVRAPSYALEGAEAAGFVGEAAKGRVKDLTSGEVDTVDVYKDNLQAADAALEAGGVDVIDIEEDSALEATEYERRVGTLGTVSKQAGSAAVEQARKNPSELSGEVVAGFGAGAAVGGAARAAKGARIASRAPDAPTSGSIGRGATITRRGSSDLDLRTRVSERVSKGADGLTDYLNQEDRAQLGAGKDGDNIIRASDIFRDRDGDRGGDTADVDAVEADGDQLMKTKQKVRTDPGDVDMDARREEFLEKAVKKRVDDTETSKAAGEVTEEVTDDITITVGEGATTTTRGAFAGATVGGFTRTRQLEQTATMLDTEMSSGVLEGLEADVTAEIEGIETTIESEATTGIGVTTTPTTTTTTTTTEPAMKPPGETTLLDPTQPGTTRRVPDIDLFGDALEMDTLDGGGQFEKEFKNAVADPDSILSGKAFEGNGL